MGEQPSLWAKLELRFEEDQPEFEEEEDPEKPLLHQVLTLLPLALALLHLLVLTLFHQVLTLRRLQSLESLSLCCWDQPMHLLQIVVDYCPNLQKLSLDFDVWGGLPEEDLARVAEILVKFEEIDLSEGFIPFGNKCVKATMRAILRALPGESSKLKILTMHCDDKKNTAALAEAKEAGVTAKMECHDDFDSDDNSDIDINSDIDNDDDDDFENYD